MSDFGICNLSLVPLRAEASDKSEIRSFLLFGDCFSILEVTNKWIRIKTVSDDFEGWIDPKQHEPVSFDFIQSLQADFSVTGPSIYQEIERGEAGESIYIVAGSSIPSLHQNEFIINAKRYRFKNLPVLAESKDFHKHVIGYASSFLNAPYLWGGKSVFGIDCSGLTQVVFKMLGISLLRDAWQQAEQGEVVNFLQEARPGDLAFFDNEEGRIIHVGIMLNDHEIIHASGRVKIDPIDGLGIYSTDLQRHTHKLRIIKRFYH